MRFHMGVSFRLSSLKKFIIPFIIGLLTYFGLNYFNIAHVNALTNMDSNYTLTLDQIDFDNIPMFNDMSFQQFFDNVISNYQQTTKNMFIVFDYYDNKYSVYIYLTNTSSSINSVFRGQNATNNNTFVVNHTSSGYGYYKFTYSNTVSTDSSVYTQFISCLNDYSNCQNTTNLSDGTNTFTKGSTTNLTYIQLHLPVTFNNNDSFNLGSFSNYGYMYYSNLNFVYSPNLDDTSTSRFYKTVNLIANNTTYSIGSQDTIPTYYDLYHNVSPDPDPEPDPEPESSDINVPFSRFVYWFGEHDSSEEILTNIYILVFMFAFGFMFLKILNIIRGVKW